MHSIVINALLRLLDNDRVHHFVPYVTCMFHSSMPGTAVTVLYLSVLDVYVACADV